VLLAVLLGAGCAPKVQSLRATHDQVDVSLSHASKHRYELWSKGIGRLGSTAAGGGRSVHFSLPQDIDPAQTDLDTLFIVDSARQQHVPERGQPWGTTWYFDNPAWPAHLRCREAIGRYSSNPSRAAFDQVLGVCEGRSEYAESLAALSDHWRAVDALERARDELGRARAEHRRLVRELARARSDFRQGDAWLASSTAYQGGECVKPPQEALPECPPDACAKADASKVATLICAARQGGSFACGELAETVGDEFDVEIHDALSGPACGAFVAATLGEDYTLRDAAWDGAKGLASEAADSAIQSDDALVRGFGYAVKGVGYLVELAEFRGCLQDERRACRQRWREWEQDKADVIAAPERLERHCKALVLQLPKLQDQIIGLERQLPLAENEVVNQDRLVGQAEAAEKELHAALDALRAGGGSREGAQRLVSYTEGGTQPDARITGERWPPVEATAWYQPALGAGGTPGQGLRFNVDFQPSAFSRRRVNLGTEIGLTFFDDDPELGRAAMDLVMVVGYQHYFFEHWAPVVRATGGAALTDYGWKPSFGGDVGAKLYLHREFHLEAMVGGSNITPLRASIGMGTNGKYPGYVILGVLVLGLAAL